MMKSKDITRNDLLIIYSCWLGIIGISTTYVRNLESTSLDEDFFVTISSLLSS